MTPALEHIPVFVKAGALLPLAQRAQHTGAAGSFQLTVRAYGDHTRQTTLYEDDGELHPTFTLVEISWRAGEREGSLARSGPARRQSYSVIGWERLA